MESEEVPPDKEKLFVAIVAMAEVKSICLDVQRRIESLGVTGIVAVDDLTTRFNRGMWNVFETADGIKNEAERLYKLNEKVQKVLGIIEREAL